LYFEVPDFISQYIKEREGSRPDVYTDSIKDGRQTYAFGFGSQLNEEEAQLFSEGDIVPEEYREQRFQRDLSKAYNAAIAQAAELGVQPTPEFVRGLTSANYQLGTNWTKEHKNTWESIRAGNWSEAAREAENSDWFGQTPNRVRDFQEGVLSMSGGQAPPVTESPNGPIQNGFYWLNLPDGSIVRAAAYLTEEEALEGARKAYPDAFPRESRGEDSGPIDAFWATANRSARGLFPGLKMALASAVGDEEAYDVAAADIRKATEEASKIAPNLVSTDEIVDTYNKEGVGAAVGKVFEFGAEQIGSSFGFQAPSAAASLGGYAVGALALGLGPAGAAVLATTAGLGTMMATFLSSDLERAYEEGGAKDTEDLNLLGAVAAAGGQTALNSLSYLLMGGGSVAKGVMGAGLTSKGKEIAQTAFAKTVQKLDRMHPVKQAAAILLEEEVAEVAQQALERAAAGLPVSPSDQGALDEYIEVMFATLAPGAGFGVGKMGMSYLSKRADTANEQQYVDWKNQVNNSARSSAEEEQKRVEENFSLLAKSIEDETKSERRRIGQEDAEINRVYREELSRARAELKEAKATGRASRREIASYEKNISDIEKKMELDRANRIVQRDVRIAEDVDRLASVAAVDIHKAAIARKINWNDDPGFMVWMSGVEGPDGNPIGKYTIDSLSEAERRAVYDVLVKIPIQEEQISFAGAMDSDVEGVVVDVLESNRGDEVTLASIRRVLGLGRTTKMNPVAKNYADRMARMGFLVRRGDKYFRNDNLSFAMEEQYAKVVPLIEEFKGFPPVEVISERTGITDPVILEDLRIASITKGDTEGVSDKTRRKKREKFGVEVDGEIRPDRYSSPEEADKAASRILAEDTRTQEEVAFESRLRVPSALAGGVPDRQVRVVEETAERDVVVSRKFQSPKLGKLYEVVDAAGKRLGLRTSRRAAQNLAKGSSSSRTKVLVNGIEVGHARKEAEARRIGKKFVDEQASKIQKDRMDVAYAQRREYYASRGQAVPEQQIQIMAEQEGKAAAAEFRKQNKITVDKVVAPTPEIVEQEGYVVREDTLSAKGEVEESKPVDIFDSEADARQFIADSEKARRGRQPSRAAVRAREDRDAEIQRRIDAEATVPPTEFPFVGRADQGVIPRPEPEGIAELEMTPEESAARVEGVAAERTLERTGEARTRPARPKTKEFARPIAEQTILGRLTELGRQIEAGELSELTSQEGIEFAAAAEARSLTPEQIQRIREEGSRPLWIRNLQQVANGVVKKLGVPVNIELYRARAGQESGAEFLTESMVVRIALQPGMESKSVQEQYAAIEPYLNHEVIHAVRQLGVIKASEWNKLTEFVENTAFPKADLEAINAARRESGASPISTGSTYKEVARVLYAGEAIKQRERNAAKAALDRGDLTQNQYDNVIADIRKQHWIDDDFTEEAVATAFQHYVRDLQFDNRAARRAPEVQKSVFKRIVDFFHEMGRRLRNKGAKSPEEIFESFRGEGTFAKRLERGKALDSWYSRRTNSAEFIALKRRARELGLDPVNPQAVDPMIEAQAVAEGNPVRPDDGTPAFADQWLHSERKNSPITRKAKLNRMLNRAIDPFDETVRDRDVRDTVLELAGVSKRTISDYKKAPNRDTFFDVILGQLDDGIRAVLVDPDTDEVVIYGKKGQLHLDLHHELQQKGVDTDNYIEALMIGGTDGERLNPTDYFGAREQIDQLLTDFLSDLSNRLGGVAPRQAKDGYVSSLLTREQQDEVDLIGTPLPGEVQLDGAFHSALGRALRTSKQRAMQLPQLLKMFEKAGVKQEELSWSGFSDSLAETPPGFKFSIDKIAKLFNSFAPRMDEKGEEVWSGFRSPDLFITEKSQGDVRWGRNYTAENLVQPGGTDYRETLIRLGNSLYDYSSPHWDETNVLVHIRWKTIEGDDGSRTLYIEEIQDDWAKSARERGYADEEYLDRVFEYRDLNDKHNKTIEEVIKIWHDNPAYVGGLFLPSEFSFANWNPASRPDFSPSKSEALLDLKKQYDGEVSKLESFGEDVTWAALGGGLGAVSRPPDRPFKKTGHELAFNYILHRAARDGYDRVAWTTAATQADRYSGGYEKGYSRIYDEMFVKQANARGKKHGVSVERDWKFSTSSDHTLEITPELREDLLGGSPLYPKRFALDKSNVVLDLEEQADLEKIFDGEQAAVPSLLRAVLPCWRCESGRRKPQ
jgi:hypothetical protein